MTDGFIQFGDGEPIPVTDISIKWVREPGRPAGQFTNSRTIPGEVIRAELESETYAPITLDGEAFGGLLEP